MSHFVVVCLLDPPDEGEVAGYTSEAEKTAAQGVRTQIGPILLEGEVPIEGEAKVLRTWAEDALGEFLEPYNENRSVDEYEKPCWCVGERAKAEVQEQIRTERPDLFDVKPRREQFRALRVLGGALDLPDDMGFEPRPSESRTALAANADLQEILRDLELGDLVDVVLGLEDAWLAAHRKDEGRIQDTHKRLDTEWKALWTERERLEKEGFEAHPDKDKAEPLCSHYYYRAIGLQSKDVSEELIREALRVAKEQAKLAYTQTEKPVDPFDRSIGRTLKYLHEEVGPTLLDPVARAEYNERGDGDDEGSCMGTGITTSTYNPESKWDWWVIGGRWAGFFIPEDEYDPNQDPRNYGPCEFCGESGLVNNDGPLFRAATPIDIAAGNTKTCHVCDGTKIKRRWSNAEFDQDIVPAEFWLSRLEDGENVVPFALVTPEGEWYEKGKMGWWAVVSDESDKEQWKNFVLETARKYAPSRLAVAVDCHI